MQPLLERWVVAAVLVAELVAVLGLLVVRCSLRRLSLAEQTVPLSEECSEALVALAPPRKRGVQGAGGGGGRRGLEIIA